MCEITSVWVYVRVYMFMPPTQPTDVKMSAEDDGQNYGVSEM